MTTLAIEHPAKIAHLSWSVPRPVKTKYGERLVTECVPDNSFWEWYRTGEGKRLGYSVSKFGGAWKACRWIKTDDAHTPSTLEPEAPPLPVEKWEGYALSGDILARFTAMQGKLLPYQVEPCKALTGILSAHWAAVDASDTGVGKTYVSLVAASCVSDSIYVICPKGVIPSWHRAAQMLGVKLQAVVNYEQVRAFKRADMVKPIPPKREGGKLGYEWVIPERSCVIFDECHRTKHEESQTTRMALALANRWEERKDVFIIGLSATLADSPLSMRVTGKITGVYQRQNWYHFLKDNGVSKTRFGMAFNRSANVLRRLNQWIFPKRGVRVRIADLGDQFPDTQISSECYEFDTKTLNAIYEEMFEAIQRIAESQAEDKVACILVEEMRARQKAEVTKVPELVSMAEDAVEEGMSVAMFFNFNDSLQEAASRLGAVVIKGGQTIEERQAAIDAFQSGAARIICCNIQAGGVGVSLHDLDGRHPRLALICPSYSGENLKQALGRVHRAGGKSKSIQRIVFAANTIEEKVCDSMRDKLKRIEIMNDGEISELLRLI